jgi:hypothetical protein
VTTCPVCRWENDADTGPCAGCGRDLSSPEPLRTPATDSAAEGTPQPLRNVSAEVAEPEAVEPEPTPGLLRGPSRPVPIRPLVRPTPQVVNPQRGPAQPVDRGRIPARAPAEAAPARSGPTPTVRSIPVVVAPSGTRPAVRRRGDEPGSDGVLGAQPSGIPSLPGAGEGLCPTCGRTVREDQYFCRCGAELPAAFRPRLQRSTSVDSAGMSIEAFRRAQRRANRGRRIRYDQPLSPRTWLVRVLAVLTVAGALGSLLPPWGDDVRAWMEERTAYASPWW